MTHRRRREVEKMVTDLGLVIGGFRTNGTSHWRVDVLTPDRKHQRPFTFPCSGHDGPRRFDEISMLKRWRRQVAPELEVAEEAGTLRPGVKTGLAAKLEELGIPFKRETVDAPPVGVSQLSAPRKATPPPFEKKTLHVNHTGHQFVPGTPEAALAATLAMEPSPAPTQEPAMSAQTAPISNQPDKRHYDNAGKMTRVQNIRFVEWMRGTGEPDARFKEHSTKTDFCAKASHALGFKVPISALNDYLDAFDLKWPEPPATAAKTAAKSASQQINDDIAAIALAISESATPMAHKAAMLAIVERRTRGTP